MFRVSFKRWCGIAGVFSVLLAGCGAQVAEPALPTRATQVTTQATPTFIVAAPTQPTNSAPATPLINTTATLADRSSPMALLGSYFNAINRQDYARAYSYWSQVPNNDDQATFAQGFSDTQFVQVLIGAPTRIGVGAGNAYAALPTLLVVQHRNGSTELFQGCYVTHRTTIEPSNTDWDLSRATIAPVAAFDPAVLLQTQQLCPENDPQLGSSDSNETPSGVVASYYDAINAKAYDKAYNRWITPPDEADLATFSKGFASTAAVQVYLAPPTAINKDTSGETATIPVLIIAKQTDNTIQTFAGCYTVKHVDVGKSKRPDLGWQLNTAVIQPFDLAANSAALLTPPCQ